MASDLRLNDGCPISSVNASFPRVSPTPGPAASDPTAGRVRSCHVLGGANRHVGGPAYTVPSLTECLTHLGEPAALVTLDYPWEGPLPTVTRTRMLAVSRGRWTRRAGGWCPAFRRVLEEVAAAGVEVMHSHGLWLFPNLYARQVAVRNRLPLVISPRGMVDPWALRCSVAKKKIAWHLMERRNLQQAAAFHATSDAEAAAIRRLGLRQPIAVIPNGVDLPDLGTQPGREMLEARFPALRGKHWLLFLSRLHPKKGLLELAGAWGSVASLFPDWRLVIAGPDENGFERIVRRALATAGVQESVTFTGPLAGAEKAAAFAHAGVFVLPTLSENFAVVVAEALAHGTPAIVTTAAPWEELNTARCGWWIEPGTEPLRRVIQETLRLPASELAAMGERGRALVAARYDWKPIGERMLQFYRWLRRPAGLPEFVRL